MTADKMYLTTEEIEQNRQTCKLVCELTGEVITDDEYYVITDDDDEEHIVSTTCFDTEFFTCDHCGDVFRKDETEYAELGDRIICRDCLDNEWRYIQCEDCGRWIDVDTDSSYEVWQKLGWRWAQATVCEDCIDNYMLCEHCEEYYPSYFMAEVHTDGPDEHWCPECVDALARSCDECNELYHEDCIHYSEGRDRWICDDCREDHDDEAESLGFSNGSIHSWRAPNGIAPYHFKPQPCFLPVYDPDEIYYGFELEVDSDSTHATNRDANEVCDASGYAYCKHDASLSNGMEIVTHPATLAYHMDKKDDWADIFRTLLCSGFRSHDAGTCGLHVHASIAPIQERNPFAVHNLLILFDRFWEQLKKFSRRTEYQLSRWAKLYCCKDQCYDDVADNAKSTYDRYMAINLRNSATIEFRMFRGTLNIETFCATLQLVHVLVERAIELGCDADRVRSITWEELVASDYEELNSYLRKRNLIGTECGADEDIDDDDDCGDSIAAC